MRIPTVSVVFLGAAAGFVFAQWMGAILGALLGTAVWWQRR